MRVHWFQHVDFEGLGLIGAWLDRHHVSPTKTAWHEPDPQAPSLDDVDALIVMGGPMSVNDEAEHPWLAEEKTYLRQAIAAGKRVLGVCLGAQLIANALGAEVRDNGRKEIGHFPIQSKDPQGHPLLQLFPKTFVPIHWHGETFDIPKGALPLGSSEACSNQGFVYGDHVLAMQFHLEIDLLEARRLQEAGHYTPDPSGSPADLESQASENAALLDSLLHAWLGT